MSGGDGLTSNMSRAGPGKVQKRLGVCAHARRLKQRQDIRAAVTADRADETLFQIGQAHVVGHKVHRDRMAACIVAAMDCTAARF